MDQKNTKKVELIQEWNNEQPAANRMLADFYIKLAARKLAFKSKHREYYYYPTTHMRKNYRHFGHLVRSEYTGTVIDGITWIENLLNNSEGMIDFRKLMIDLVIAPYLVNIKQYDYDTAYSKITEWLDKCGRRRRLDFNPRYKVNYALKRSLKTGIKPMKLDTMMNDYYSMYEIMQEETRKSTS